MTPREYEIAVFAQTVWQLARSSDVNELAAVACTIRNLVIPRIGQIAAFPSYLEACEASILVYPTRQRPALTDIAFTDPTSGFLAIAEDIYDCSYQDITASHDHSNGAKYFYSVSGLAADHWFQIEILNQPEKHPLLGTFGALQFFQ